MDQLHEDPPGSELRVEPEPEPEPEPELELRRRHGQQLDEGPAPAPVRCPARGWLAANPPIGFDDTALQFFAPDRSSPMASFGGFGLLAHPHLWCYDSEGALPFLPMLLVEQHITGPEVQSTSVTSCHSEGGQAATTTATLTERLGAARCVTDVLETVRAAMQVDRFWTVQRFVIVHR